MNCLHEMSLGTTHLTSLRITSRDTSLVQSGGDYINYITTALLSDLNVAFSAYMDHDADNLGPGQTLKYNQVLLNDGNGYNKHSGVFTAPVGGVYSFSFFIGQRDIHQELVALWVNSENKMDAVVQASHTSQDLQGGNIVNLKLVSGDIVYIKNILDGHVEGSKTERLTSFSGFLIYPVESATVVG